MTYYLNNFIIYMKTMEHATKTDSNPLSLRDLVGVSALP